MVVLAEVVELLHAWFPPSSAASWDAVGLVCGDPRAEVSKVMFAVDPVQPVADEAVAWGADLLVTHHPLFLRPVHGVAETTPKARTLATLMRHGCALLCAHTNADVAEGGVSEAMAAALGVTDAVTFEPEGLGRVSTVAPTTLRAFAEHVAAALPATGAGSVRVAGDLDAPVSRVALCPGAGDDLLDEVLAAGADVYVTSDLRHHIVSEFVEKGGRVVEVPHWAAEWTWLPVVARRLADALSDAAHSGAAAGDTVDTRVSTIVTDPWSARI